MIVYLADFVKELTSRAVYNLAAAVLKLLYGCHSGGVGDAYVKGQPTSDEDLTVKHTDSVGRTYPDGGKYPFCLLFDNGLDASIDVCCLGHGSSRDEVCVCNVHLVHNVRRM
jgi:hypothetical protein